MRSEIFAIRTAAERPSDDLLSLNSDLRFANQLAMQTVLPVADRRFECLFTAVSLQRVCVEDRKYRRWTNATSFDNAIFFGLL
jgi:hypothetical protein